jgi:hypothetical protein
MASKFPLLDKDKEIQMRRKLPAGVRMYTGDDFNYAELIAGDGFGEHWVQGQSDALLGIFDAIAPAASAALGELAQGRLRKVPCHFGANRPFAQDIFSKPPHAFTKQAWSSWPG